MKAVIVDVGSPPPLGVGMFTEEELKKSYRSLCSKYHPDKTSGRTTALFQEVQLGKKELDDDLKSRSSTSSNQSWYASDHVKSYTSYEEFYNGKSKPFQGFEKQKASEPTQPTEKDIINHLKMVNDELRNKVGFYSQLAFSHERRAASIEEHNTLLSNALNLLKEENGKLKNQKPEKKKWWQIF